RVAKTPWRAALAVFACATPFALSGRIGLVAEVTNFAIYVIFIAVNVSVIRLRFLLPNLERSFRVPLSFGGFPVPTVLAIVTTALMMYYVGANAWVLGALMLASGVGAWWVGPSFGRKRLV